MSDHEAHPAGDPCGEGLHKACDGTMDIRGPREACDCNCHSMGWLP